MQIKVHRRVKGLDGLRAFAILGIVFYHMIPRIVPGGFLGVTLFFTIMGYLLIYTTRSVIDGDDKKFSIIGYYQKKILRLYPPLVMTALLSILLLIILPVHYTKGTLAELASVFLGYNNWWQIFKNGSYFTRITSASPFTHLWYLGLTIQYYLIWPFIVILLAKLRKRGKPVSDMTLLIIFGILSVLSALEMILLYNPKSDPSRIYYGTDTRAYSLLLGMIIAVLPADTMEWISEKLDQIPYFRYAAAGILTIFMIVMYFTVDGTTPATYRGLMILFNIFAALLLILVLVSQDTIGSLLEARPLVWIGEKSYTMYLVMYPVIFFVSRLLKKDGTIQGMLISLILIVVLARDIDRFDRLLRRKYGSDIVLTAPSQKGNHKKHARSKTVVNTSPILQKFQKIVSAVTKLVTASYRNIVFTLLAVIFIFSGCQSLYIHVTHPTDDSAVMEEQINANKKLLEEQTAGGSSSDDPTASEEGNADDSESITPAGDTSITAIGDSVMLGAASQMQTAIPEIYIDAEVGRQVRNTVDVINADDENGNLGHTVILHLGTNGVFNQTTGQEVIDRLGKDRIIYWINAYGTGITWANDVNTTIAALCDANENVTYVDWASQAAAHPEWFYSDGIHLNPDGAAAYSDFIKQAVGR